MRPRPQGGDKRSTRTKVHAKELLVWVDETPDIILAKIAERMANAYWLKAAQHTVRCLLNRRGIMSKKSAPASKRQHLTF